MKFPRHLLKLFPFYFAVVILGASTVSCHSSSIGNKEAGSDQDSILSAHLLSKRIFFLLYQIKNTPDIRRAILQNKALEETMYAKKKSISKALAGCDKMDCLVKALLVSENEDRVIKSALSDLYSANSFFDAFIKNEIRPSHAYSFYSNYSDSTLFIEAWEEQVEGLNYILHAYLQGKGLHYPTIDSSSFYVNGNKYMQSVKYIVEKVLSVNDKDLFFESLLDISIKLLQLNYRDEAVRFLPLSVVNRNAYKKISATDWEHYPYSGILVFGKGPEDAHVAISQGSKVRCRMGAELYKAKKAPFIVVSGGYVHPYQTKYCEAEEMKRYMIDSLHVPEEVIIMEPHARHTTTNIRNTNRIFLTCRIPRAKPILGVTEKSHIDYIVSDRFVNAYKRDIGFIAFAGLKRLSDTTISYYPTMSSFQINTMEPLDP